MWVKYKQQAGFTIVELLIVIVIIGILAAITIVAYNGIQNKATNQSMASAVHAYYSALTAYEVDNGGTYPTGNGCLGAQAVYTSNPCYIGSGTYNYNSSINTALGKYMSSTPSVPNKSSTDGSSVTASGIFYYSGGQYIGFLILGTNTCPSIAGATEQTKSTLGSDVFCRIKFPGL